MPVNTRTQHYGQRIAKTTWTGCDTDPFLDKDDAAKIVRAHLTTELESSHLFRTVTNGSPSASDVVIRSEIRVFCSQAVGFLILTVAGISSIHIEVEQNGKRLFERTFERVVTDDDPEYTGWQVTTIEQAMVRTMADSLRELLRDALQQLDQSLPH
jgi:hypothetical protein